MKITALAPLILSFGYYAGMALGNPVELGARPMYLVDQMPDGSLKSRLLACASNSNHRSDFSIGHRGAPLMFPEHTYEGYAAAARMGAGFIECDVTFTADLELVCRHSQNDLHTSTNILATGLSGKCKSPFKAASAFREAGAECRTTDITLEEFQTLAGKMDSHNSNARTLDEYMQSTPRWRTDLYATGSRLLTHSESIVLLKSFGVKFIPELKTPVVHMPFQGFSQTDFVQKLVDEYRALGIPAADVFIQSFNLADLDYLIRQEPDFGAQAVFLDGGYRDKSWSPSNPQTWVHTMDDLKSRGINYIAPPFWALIALDGENIVASEYSLRAKAAGLKIVPWTVERTNPFSTSGNWHYQNLEPVLTNDLDVYTVLDVLLNQIGVTAVFSDWPATTTFFANCMASEN